MKMISITKLMWKLEIEVEISEFNADVTESDRNTCKSIICEECKAEFVLKNLSSPH